MLAALNSEWPAVLSLFRYSDDLNGWVGSKAQHVTLGRAFLKDLRRSAAPAPCGFEHGCLARRRLVCGQVLGGAQQLAKTSSGFVAETSCFICTPISRHIDCTAKRQCSMPPCWLPMLVAVQNVLCVCCAQSRERGRQSPTCSASRHYDRSLGVLWNPKSTGTNCWCSLPSKHKLASSRFAILSDERERSQPSIFGCKLTSKLVFSSLLFLERLEQGWQWWPWMRSAAERVGVMQPGHRFKRFLSGSAGVFVCWLSLAGRASRQDFCRCTTQGCGTQPSGLYGSHRRLGSTS